MVPLNSFTSRDSNAGKWTLPEIALCSIMLLFLVPNFSHAIYCGYEGGWWPLKPRDYNLSLAVIALVVTLFCKPAFSLLALALLTIPMPRILDAALLQRYEILEWGGHQVYVFTMVSLWVISAVGILSIGTSKGVQTAIAVAVLTIIACTAANLYEWSGRASWTLIPGRMAGWHLDPNNSPIIMCLMLGILFTFQKRFWWNLVWTGGAAVGIALTMSRSGMMVFGVLVSLYIIFNIKERFFGILMMSLIAVPVLAVGLGVLDAANSAKGITKNADTASRMEAIYNLDFEKLKSPERKKDLLDAWEAVCKQPVTGWGTGSGALRWRPHNMIVSHWIDVGIFGVLQYGGALVTFTFCCLLRRFRGLFCLIPVWLFIPCSQVLLEMPAYWYTWGVAAYTLFPKRFAIVLGTSDRGTNTASENVPALSSPSSL